MLAVLWSSWPEARSSYCAMNVRSYRGDGVSPDAFADCYQTDFGRIKHADVQRIVKTGSIRGDYWR